MPVREAVEATIVPAQDTAPDLQAEQPLEANINQAGAQGYEYTRQDGTVERAGSADEAIRICPVLGKLATQDPEAAKLLLDMNSIGQQKMAEKPVEQPKPDTHKQSEPTKAEKPEKPITAPTVVQPPKEAILAQQKEPTATQADITARLQAEHLAAEQFIQKEEPAVVEATHKEPVFKDMVAVTSSPSQTPRHKQIARPNKTFVDRAQQAILLHEQRAHEHEVTQTTEQARNVVRIEEVPHEPTPALSVELFGMPLADVPDQPDSLTIERLTLSESEEHAIDQMETEGPDILRGESIMAFDHELTGDVENPNLSVIEGTDLLSEQVIQPEQMRWADEIDKESTEIYEDFIEALRLFAELPALPLEPNGNQAQAETTDEYAAASLDVVESRPVPLIVQAVAERLTELEPEAKEAVLPLVHDVVTVVAELQQFSIDEAKPEIVEAAEVQCQELIIVLFETLGIEYEEEDIKAFMNVILRPDFQPPIQTKEVIEVDLEHNGTREAKRHFTTQFTTGLTAAEARLQRLLGTFVLFYTHLAME